MEEKRFVHLSRAMIRRGLPWSLAMLSALMIVLIGILTIAGLWLLRRFNDHAAQQNVALSVMDSGRHMARSLAQHTVPTSPESSPREWRQFSRMVAALHAVEPNLQYVSIHREGITVFHRLTDPMLEAPPPPPGMMMAEPDLEPVRIRRRMLDLGDRQVPVMVFAQRLEQSDGAMVEIEVGLKRDVLDVRHAAVAHAVRAMFRISVAVMVTAFGLCLVLISTLAIREQRREARRRQAEHLAFSGIMANGIAHDFRNPMSSLRLDAQMLARVTSGRAVPDPARIEHLAVRMGRTVERMDAVLREFLYLSKPHSESVHVLDLRECLRECLETLAGRMESAAIRCVEEWPPEPLWARTTGAALRRAMTNILLNAIQHSPRGSEILICGVRRPGVVGVAVHDQGPGIPRQDRQRVFDLFYSSRPGGTGLGLFLAQTAVRDHGGRIEIDDSPSRGACITVWLPADPTGKQS